MGFWIWLIFTLSVFAGGVFWGPQVLRKFKLMPVRWTLRHDIWKEHRIVEMWVPSSGTWKDWIHTKCHCGHTDRTSRRSLLKYNLNYHRKNQFDVALTRRELEAEYIIPESKKPKLTR